MNSLVGPVYLIWKVVKFVIIIRSSLLKQILNDFVPIHFTSKMKASVGEASEWKIKSMFINVFGYPC